MAGRGNRIGHLRRCHLSQAFRSAERLGRADTAPEGACHHQPEQARSARGLIASATCGRTHHREGALLEGEGGTSMNTIHDQLATASSLDIYCEPTGPCAVTRQTWSRTPYAYTPCAVKNGYGVP
jgi:hypothetical protein